MKIDYFRYFVSINRLHSISATAKLYNIRQNTLSNIVRQAEEEFGFPIFLRTTDGVACTPQGEEFIKRAQAIDDDYSQILSIKKQVKGIASVSLVMDPVTCSVMAMPLTTLFYRSGSRGNLRFHEAEPENLISSFGKNSAKIGLVRLDSENLALMERKRREKELALEPMAWDELCVLVSDRHPLAAAESVRQCDLEGHCLVCHQAMEQEVCRVLGIGPEGFSALRCHDGHLYEAVAEKGMAAIVSRFSAEHGKDWTRPGICILPLRETRGENRQELVMLYLPEAMGKRRSQTMADCIRAWFGQQEEGRAQQ